MLVITFHSNYAKAKPKERYHKPGTHYTSGVVITCDRGGNFEVHRRVPVPSIPQNMQTTAIPIFTNILLGFPELITLISTTTSYTNLPDFFLTLFNL